MRRELQTEQMRRRILDSALEVFGAEGYDGASMNAICTRAGISKGIIYHYFAGKDPALMEQQHKCADIVAGAVDIAARIIEEGRAAAKK